MAEAAEQPPHMILLDPYFVVYRGRRRRLISGLREIEQVVKGRA